VLDPHAVEKIAHFCQVDPEHVLVVRDMPTIYQVPILLEDQKLIPILRDVLKLDQLQILPALQKKGAAIWRNWKNLTGNPDHYYQEVTIALVGKYIELHDSYISVIKSLEHSAMRCRRKLRILWVDSEHLETKTQTTDPVKFHKAWHETCTAHGILVPGGFGVRGTEGMIAAAKWARENKTPYLGICLGMQTAVIEYARNVCGLQNATSEEFNARGEDRVIKFMPEVDKTTMGATMRLGLRPTIFQPGSEWSKLRALYNASCPTSGSGITDDPRVNEEPAKDQPGTMAIMERHRHRYEVNPEYINRLEDAGMTFIGKDEVGERMEVIELQNHPWFVGVQFHPEYLSRVLEPSRPYLGFVAASAGVLADVTAELQIRDDLIEKRTSVNGVANDEEDRHGSF
jgi:CTP synthase